MFYLQYAIRSFWRNRRWSLFAVFSIAAGVATIVALRSLGLAIGDSLTSNLRATNHGDITISLPGEGPGRILRLRRQRWRRGCHTTGRGCPCAHR